jgi:hypothetical protein
MRRLGRLCVALGVLLAAASPALPARAASASPVTAGHARVRLLGQSTWVKSGGQFVLRLAVSSAAPSTDQLQVSFFPALTARTTFDQDAAGDVVGYPIQTDVLPLRSLPAAPGGGVLVRIPVDPAAAGSTAAFDAGPTSTVYPVQVRELDAAGSPLGSPLTTFLVFDAGTGGFTHLDVALVVPFGLPPSIDRRGVATAPPRSGVDTLAAELAALQSAPGVPVSLAAVPQTLSALGAGSGLDQGVLRRFAALVGAGDQLLPSTFAGTSPASLTVAGLGGQIPAQIDAGTAALRSVTDTTPSQRTWALDGPLDPATLATLEGQGLRRLVLPSQALSALPPALLNTTFARPALLRGGTGTVEVYGADPVLSARVGRKDGPVLAAELDLAELAMIQLESPSLQRGVVVLPPPGVSPVWLRLVLSGLSGNPFASAVTVDGLFAHVRPLSAAEHGPTQSLVGRPRPVPDAAALVELQGRAGLLGVLAPGATALRAEVERTLLLAASVSLSPAARDRVLDVGFGLVGAVVDQVKVPGSSSVTLTSSSAVLPVTIESDPALTLHLQVVLRSSKLAFRPLHPVAGSCRAVASLGIETCDLAVHAASLTLRVPVAARTSGVFPMQVSVLSPDGTTVLTSEQITIRSTSIPFVGLLLLIGAVLFLAIWWVRDLRHGRRARRLVPPPSDDDPGGGGPDARTPEPPPGGPTVGLSDWTVEPSLTEVLPSPGERAPRRVTVPDDR